MIKKALTILPWALLSALILFLYLGYPYPGSILKGKKHINSSVLLTEMEKMGKLELVNYTFQEITEFVKEGDNLDLKVFKIPIYNGAKALLISYGNAVGCIDLTKISRSDIIEREDTVYLKLPEPELCYFKIDLEKSRIYDMDTQYLSDHERKEFIREMYQVAEQEIKNSALNTNLLEQARQNAGLILKPLLKSVSGKEVVIVSRPTEVSIRPLKR